MKCPKCKTEFGYVRFDTKEWVCRKCGIISKIKVIEKVDNSKKEVMVDHGNDNLHEV